MKADKQISFRCAKKFRKFFKSGERNERNPIQKRATERRKQKDLRAEIRLLIMVMDPFNYLI